MNGTIKKLVTDKSFGWIRGEDGVEYFFHASGLKNTRFNTLVIGQEVTFEDSTGGKGPRAEDIYVGR